MDEGIQREMHHGECLMTPEDTERCLSEETWGVLSVCGDDGYPYGVPMNYVWDEGTVLLHGTSESSHRLDALRRSEKVCFTVVPEHTLDREQWSTVYTSVIVFGKAEIIEAPAERRIAMRAFMQGLSPSKTGEALQICDPETANLVMIRIRPVRITGKKST